MGRRRVAGVVVCALLTIAVVPSVACAVPSIPSAKFKSAQTCGCHAWFVDMWSGSMHAKAYSDPLYQAKLADANRATKGALGPFCNSCHTPIGTMSGEVKTGRLSRVAKEGITCDFCHQVTGTGKPLGNASWTVQADGTKRAQLTDARTTHKWAYSKFHTTPEFCGTCHNVNHPGNGMHLEATYSEWSKSAYAKQGVTCQDCHMTPGPRVTKPYAGQACATGPQRQHIYLMQWPGANGALGPADLAEEQLKGAATVDLQVPDFIASGGSSQVTVTIANVAAGHYLPTGLTEVRQMWLEVTAEDGAGNEVMKERHDFGTVLKNAKGEYPVELWEAVAIHTDDRIAPLGSKSFAYPLTMPQEGQVKVTAALYYRSASEEFASEAELKLPTVTMTSAHKTAYSSEEMRAEALGEAIAEATKGGGGPWPMIIAVLGFGAIGAIVAWGIVRQLRA